MGISTEAENDGGSLVSPHVRGHVNEARAEGTSCQQLLGDEGGGDEVGISANVGAKELATRRRDESKAPVTQLLLD